jgi:hypothetical protein
MTIKTLFLFFSVLFAQQFAHAIALSSSFHLFSEGVLVDSDGKASNVYAQVLCRRGSVTCSFTQFYEGKINSSDFLVPWFMDDDVSAPDLRNVSIIYQTGNIMLNQQVIGKVNTIHRAFGGKENIEFYVPFTIDNDTRTLFIGH